MKVRVDRAKNRIYINIGGNVSKAELNKLYTDVRFSVGDMQPGFGVITDLSNSTLAHLDGIATYKKIMRYIVTNGVGQIVRVIDKDSTLYKQIHNLSTSICSYIPNYVSTLEEAELQLDKKDRRNGLRFHYNTLQPAEFEWEDKKEKGNIVNISTSGCFVENPSRFPSVGEETILFLALAEQGTAPCEFTIKGQIIRVEEKGFAIEYMNLEEKMKKQLWECLLEQFEHEMKMK